LIIEGSIRQLGEKLPRMILTPFKLVNHGCKGMPRWVPVSQARDNYLMHGRSLQIPNTYAYMIIFLKTVPTDTEITVHY